MTKAEKEVLEAQLAAEKKVMRELLQVYRKAGSDVEEKIRRLSMRTDLENLQTIVYQQRYQEIIEKQIEGILNNLNSNQYETVEEYLKNCYEDGYIGVMYDIQKQGVPITMPINQQKVVEALQIDSKLSSSYYERSGTDVRRLKNSIRAEVSRGIAEGASWNQVATRISRGMNSPVKKAMRDAMRIARTEGHRINQKAHLDAYDAARAKGADVVKQWCATLDKRTRDTHAALDGMLVESDGLFESPSGAKAKAPSHFGIASEDINCRCTLLQRARWALDERELQELKERADYYGLDKAEDLDSFKKRYLKLPADADTKEILEPRRIKDRVISEICERFGVKHVPVTKHVYPLSEDQIIKTLAGGDRTKGSCASVGLAYAGQKSGFACQDFRGGDSQEIFSGYVNLKYISGLPGLKTITKSGVNYCTIGKQLLQQVETGKEYYFVCGRHAAIVRRAKDKTLQYLELQSQGDSGWHNFDGNPRYTLSTRFGCPGRSYHGAEGFMIDVDSFKDCEVFPDILGYINTAPEEQRKGKGGGPK